MIDISRVKYLRQELDNECISTSELLEIEEAFAEIPDDDLRDLRENAMADDMLDEIESKLDPLETAVYNYILESYGETEALEPSWAIGPLVEFIREELKDV